VAACMAAHNKLSQTLVLNRVHNITHNAQHVKPVQERRGTYSTACVRKGEEMCITPVDRPLA
jgi:hypothetical protein